MNHTTNQMAGSNGFVKGKQVAAQVQAKLESELQILRSCVQAFQYASEKTQHDGYAPLFWPDLMEIVEMLIPKAESVQAIEKIVPVVLDAFIDADWTRTTAVKEQGSRRGVRANGVASENAVNAGGN